MNTVSFFHYLMLTPPYAESLLRDLAREQGVFVESVSFDLADGPGRMDVVIWGTKAQARELDYRFGWEQTP